ncbi:uncharacterized protein J8A68_005992 [[Candida] subhashii]|uniref:NAD-dependent epimerase/dehydratase domain-containing protein n=1 Tax=[Candida] subhashii TaxID=561895 RepID=A0A8J5UDS9_9ASCO|nr:uncharacterized protein J8A68_005992 [[Candida] subhashii]KAG7660573.1 hypothetical protein J8A68_005992 [[Candida] subhashii]
MSPTTVFISGANGYIAQHIVKQLLEQGHSVVGSVRTATKGESLKELTQSDKFSYEVVPELESPGAFDQALKRHPEVAVFLHTASPVGFGAEDIENFILRPAIEGTKNALRAIVEYAPQVKKVVVTSSGAAISGFGKYFSSEKIYTEEDWNPITLEEALEHGFNGYQASKKYAELAAWDFIKENKVNFDLITIIPTFVFGPQAYGVKDKSQLNLSAEIVNSVIKLSPDDKIPEQSDTFIDVRDVAKAHIIAFETDKAINQRLLLSSERQSLEKVAHIVNKHFPDLKIPQGSLAKHEEQSAISHKDNSSKTKEILGFEYYTLEQSVVDAVKQLIEAN